MIADDFKAINAAMKANDATSAAAESYETVIAIPDVGPTLAPIAAALAFAECTIRKDVADGVRRFFTDMSVPGLYEIRSIDGNKVIEDLQERHRMREFLGDPEC